MICALFRTGTSEGLLWRRQWTFVFNKMRGVSGLALELLVSQEGAGTLGLVIWLDGTEFAELPQVLHTATTFSFWIWYPASSAVPTTSLLGFVMVGCCLKLGCILHLFIIKLLVSVRFGRRYLCIFPLFYLLLSLCTLFIVFYVFFLRLVSLPSLSSSCLLYYISLFVPSGFEKGLHCQPTLTFFCKEITDFKLRPEPI
jgi:hypothetical protein